MNIKADATIVSAAGKFAQAQKPFSMKDMATGFISDYKDMMDGISTNFEKSMKEINSVNDGVQSAIDKLATQINDGTIENRGERDEMMNVLADYRNQLEGIGLYGEENKRKREDLLYDVNKYIKDNQSSAQKSQELITNFQTKAYDPVLTGAGALDFIGQVAKYYTGDDTDANFQVHKEDGKVSFSFTSKDGEKFDHVPLGELNDMLVVKDTALIADVNKIFNDAKATAKSTRGVTEEMLFGNMQNELLELFKNNTSGFSSVTTTKMFGQPMSYYEALHDPNSEVAAQIFSVLYEMNPELDTKGDNGKPDGKITREDFGTEENYMQFVKTLTQPSAEDRDFAFNVAAKWFTDTEGQRSLDIGRELMGANDEVQDKIDALNERISNLNKKAETKLWTETKDSLYIGGTDQYLKHGPAMQLYNALGKSVDGKEASVTMLGTKFTYDPAKNEWYEMIEGDDGEERLSYGGPQSFVSSLGISESQFLDLVTPKSSSKSTGDWAAVDTNQEEEAQGLGSNYVDEVFNINDWTRDEKSGNWTDGKGGKIYAGSGRYDKDTQSDWGAMVVINGKQVFASPSQAEMMVGKLLGLTPKPAGQMRTGTSAGAAAGGAADEAKEAAKSADDNKSKKDKDREKYISDIIAQAEKNLRARNVPITYENLLEEYNKIK